MSSRAAGDPVLHFKTSSTVTTDGGSTRRLPAGYFLNEEQWRERDEKLKAAEEARTRLTAENQSLRKSATEYPWAATALVGAFGVAVGIFVMATK
jgi:hypothetical protein